MQKFIKGCLAAVLCLLVLGTVGCGKKSEVVGKSSATADSTTNTESNSATEITGEVTDSATSETTAGSGTPTALPKATEKPAPTATPKKVTGDVVTEQWVAAEIAFQSSSSYTDPFNNVDVDVVFTAPSGKTYQMPAFWNGNKEWRVRFAPTECGIWKWKTVCTNISDTGLNGKTGTMGCNAYSGNLDIYKHGFVTAVTGKKFFTYADGTPFFYLGDTHWTMGYEPLEGMFKTVVDKRVQQGFTVYQSEPIGNTYTLSNGFSQSDVTSFQTLDKKFQYLASAGLVHANAQMVFVSELNTSWSAAYVAKLCRYWVARYAAYPVLWTTAQECDNDFYDAFSAGNPWIKVAEYMHQYDPYAHPLTAHQEYSGNGNKNTMASTSAFNNVTGHNWYAAQWALEDGALPRFYAAKDFWMSTKVSVDYENCYQNLATKTYGARAQGWIAFLNGFAGYGYGVQDIWYLNSTYQANTDTVKSITITTADKKETRWTDSMNFACATELGTYMRSFFQGIDWQSLVPDFDSGRYFKPDQSLYSAATIENRVYVCYFYNMKGTETKKKYDAQGNVITETETLLWGGEVNLLKTGSLYGLAKGAAYEFQWFNPRTGKTEKTGTFMAENPYWSIGNKPDQQDWVLLVTRK